MAPKKEIGDFSGTMVKRGRGRLPNHGRGGGARGGGGSRGGDRDDDAVPMEEVGGASPPAGSDSCGDFTIQEFVLVLYHPLENTQWLPQAIADALDGDDLFYF